MTLFKATQKTTQKISPREQILEALRTNPKTTREELARMLGKSPNTIKEHLAKLTLRQAQGDSVGELVEP